MTSSILLDSLISKSNNHTLYFNNQNCPLSLLKETILRGFQVIHLNKRYWKKHRDWCCDNNGSGNGNGWGLGDGYGYGYGDIEGAGSPLHNYGDGSGKSTGHASLPIGVYRHGNETIYEEEEGFMYYLGG